MSRRARARDMLAEGAPSHAGFVPSSQHYPSKPTSFLSIIRLSTEHNGIVVLVGFFTASASHLSHTLSNTHTLSPSPSLSLSLSLSYTHAQTSMVFLLHYYHSARRFHHSAFHIFHIFGLHRCTRVAEGAHSASDHAFSIAGLSA